MKTEVKIYDLKQLQVILHGTIHFMAPSNITDKDNYIASFERSKGENQIFIV
ncbi:hypothetical protein [Dulcicalothrix desertica]|uniref:hypothetical protein n=1 Tax=Dulcicalothrix desertica TaxID=32056 RepID=UPI001315415C|nr:hypothetical protein [Dulcicalothrix desertica]